MCGHPSTRARAARRRRMHLSWSFLLLTSSLFFLAGAPAAPPGPVQSDWYLRNPWVIGAEVGAAAAVPVAVSSAKDDIGNGWEEADDPSSFPQIPGAIAFDLPNLTTGEGAPWCKLKS